MASMYAGEADIKIFLCVAPTRTPSDEIVEKLKARRAEILRKLGPEAKALREEFNEITAALAAYKNAKGRNEIKRKKAAK